MKKIIALSCLYFFFITMECSAQCAGHYIVKINKGDTVIAKCQMVLMSKDTYVKSYYSTKMLQELQNDIPEYTEVVDSLKKEYQAQIDEQKEIVKQTKEQVKLERESKEHLTTEVRKAKSKNNELRRQNKIFKIGSGAGAGLSLLLLLILI